MSDPVTAPTKIGWLAALSPRYWATPSVAVLIAANLLPLVGVAYWGWDLYALMLLYWLETAIIGIFAMVQMAIARPLASLFLVPFFTVHFGAFMAGHLLFLTVLFGGGKGLGQLSAIPAMIWNLITQHGLWIALIALFASHAVSFALNILQPAWWTSRADIEPAPPPSEPQQVMAGAYARIFVMHATIIFGALLMSVFDTKLVAFALLVALKIVVDVAAHVRKNFREAQRAST
jgi:Family of unknown function (DUF6498)